MALNISPAFSEENKQKTNVLLEGFVYLSQFCPSIKQNLKYASSENFTGKIVRGYYTNSAILTSQAARSLCMVQKELELQSRGLLIWDAYRPTQAVDCFLEWKHHPDIPEIKNKFYPNLNKEEIFKIGLIAPGHSTHSRGSTVDLTIIDKITGKALDMGTNFDFFDKSTYTNSKEVSQEAQKNRKYLVDLMHKYGFKNYPKEWWHFTLENEPFPETYFNFPVE